MLEEAKKYLELGWSIIPINNKEKKPPISWEEFQHRLPTEEEIKKWWRKWPKANIAVVTGKISGIVVVDIDQGGKIDWDDKSVRSRTGNGEHRFYIYPEDKEIPSSVDHKKKVDIRGDAGYAILPPSLHSNGRRYEWITSPLESKILPPPSEFFKMIEEKKQEKRITKLDEWNQLLEGVPEGQRNDTCTRLAGHFISKGWEKEKVINKLQDWNTKNTPPLPPEEVEQVAESIWKIEKLKIEETELEFPEEAYIGVAGEFANLYSTYLESPKSFFFMSFLTCLGVLISDKVTLGIETHPQPRLFTIILGQTAITRKTTAVDKTLDFFREVMEKKFPEIRGIGSAVGLAKELEHNSSLLLHFDEFKTFVDKAKRPGSVLLPTLSELFEINTYDNRAKEYKIEIKNAYLSLIACSTQETYERMWIGSFLDIGFLNRLFIVTDKSNKKRPLPQEIDPKERRKLVKKVQKVLDKIDSKYQKKNIKIFLELTPEAEKIFTDWYNQREESPSEARLDTYGHRLMILLAVSKGENMITEETVKAVLKILEYELEIRRMCDPIDSDTLIGKMEEKIRRVLKKGPKTRGKLKWGCHAERCGLWVFDKALINLQKEKEVIFKNKRYYKNENIF